MGITGNYFVKSAGDIKSLLKFRVASHRTMMVVPLPAKGH